MVPKGIEIENPEMLPLAAERLAEYMTEIYVRRMIEDLKKKGKFKEAI